MTAGSPLIAFIGFGEAAQAFVRGMKCPTRTIRAFDIRQYLAEGAALRDAARDLGVGLAPDAQTAAGGAELVFSAVTAGQSLAAVEPLAGRLMPGQVLIDINSVSAGRKRAMAALIRRAVRGMSTWR